MNSSRIEACKTVLVWCEEIVAYKTAAYLISRSRHRGHKVVLLTRAQNACAAAAFFPDILIVPIEKLDKRLWFFLYNLYQLIISDIKFSPMYLRALEWKFGVFTTSVLPVLRNRVFKFLVEKLYRAVTNTCEVNIKCDLVYTVTRVSRPYLLAKLCSRNIVVLESWDHVYKSPWHLNARFCVAWNDWLARDVSRLQHIKSCYPLKPLRFLFDSTKISSEAYQTRNQLIREHYVRDLNAISALSRKMPVLVYAMATSEQNKKYFDAECAELLEFLKVASARGFGIFIKPKPLSKGSSLVEKFKYYPNTVVGAEPLFDYGEDQMYNYYIKFVKHIIDVSYAVVDCGSTFSFEAILGGRNVLSVRNHFRSRSATLSYFLGNPHLELIDSIGDRALFESNSYDDVFDNMSRYDISRKLTKFIENDL